MVFDREPLSPPSDARDRASDPHASAAESKAGADRRAGVQGGEKVGAVILAAGSSRRAGRINKLLHDIEGEPMIRRVARTTIDSGVHTGVVVLGHEAERVREALRDLPVEFVVNDTHTEGMGTSIARGVDAISSTDVDAAFIVLGDMPFLRVEDLERLLAAYRASPRHSIVVPEAGHGPDRRLGNPVLWPRRYFEELRRLRGDRGAKPILLAASETAVRVPLDHPGVLRDIDTP